MRVALAALDVILGIGSLFWRRLDHALLRWTLPPRPFPWRFLAILAVMGVVVLGRATRPARLDGIIYCREGAAHERLAEQMRERETAAIRPAPADSAR